MFCMNLLTYLLILSSFFIQVNLEGLSEDDVFQVIGIDVHNLRFMHVDVGKTEFGKLNDLLLERTDSTEPKSNLNIILEQLILDYKNKLPTDSRGIQAKKLILSLGTIRKENECSYYGYKIISSCFEAIGTKISTITNGGKMRRIDEILAYYIKRHIENCKKAYFKNFDEISKNRVDKIQMKRVDTLLGKAIDSLTSDERFRDKDTNYVERLYHVASREAGSKILEPSYIYDAIKELSRGEPEKLLQQMGGGRTGFLRVEGDKLYERLFNEFVRKPCKYFRHHFGPNVFEPVDFISKFGHQLQYNKVDFYESWIKYKLCFFNGSVKKTFDRFIEYFNHTT